MINNIVIRGEFLVDDLRTNILVNNSLNENITRAWIERQRTLAENGIIGEEDIVYDFNNGTDLKECIDMGLDAEDIAYLVDQYRDNQDNSHLFKYSNGITYGLHILPQADVYNAICQDIKQIAYDVLTKPFKGANAKLYEEFVVPMIVAQTK